MAQIHKLIPVLFIFCFLGTITVFGQYKVTINALVLDQKTNQPVPYVNIGFVDKTVGTITNKDGEFKLTYHEDNIGGKEILRFSALGYKPLDVRASQLVPFLTNTNKFYLVPAPITLDDVYITNEVRETTTIGNKGASDELMGYWKDKEGLGGEIATLVKVKKKNTKLQDLHFNIIENTVDSLKIRVNIYDYQKGYPQQKLLQQNIFYTIKRDTKTAAIDLSSYNISVDKNFVVGIELIEVYGDAINFAINAAQRKGVSFIRLISQDKWIRYPSTGMNFSLTATIPSNSSKEVVKLRELPKKILLYYDVSGHMQARNKQKELAVLEAYLKKIKNVSVTVIKFNSSPYAAQEFTITNGDAKTLISYLSSSFYDGASDFKDILKDNSFNADLAILFTNGMTSFTPLEQEINIPTFSINSLEKAAHFRLQKAAFYADGHYLNLSKISEKQALNLMLNEIDDSDIYDDNSNLFSAGNVKGKVYSTVSPIQGASIVVKDTYTEAISNVEGDFTIDAEAGDILQINHLGMEEKAVTVPDNEVVDILMDADGELLDEITIRAERKKEELKETGFRKIDQDKLGYSISTITKEDIPSYAINISDVIRGRFAGVRVLGSFAAGQTPRYLIRGGGNSLSPDFAMFDIDGIVYAPGQDLPYIDPQSIESISILKSLSATVKYGNFGRGGAIVVRTQLGQSNPGQQKLDTLLVKGNDYKELQLNTINAIDAQSTYLGSLKNASSFENAKELYYDQKIQQKLWPIPYYLEVSDYFLKWDKDFANSILSNIAVVATNNYKALRVLAYKLEERQLYTQAALIYERIKALRPQDSQSYRDLAHSYQLIGEYQKAMDIYKQILSNSIEGVDFSGLEQTIQNDLMHLLAFHRSKVSYRDLPSEYLIADYDIDRRMVFEWSDPQAEFEIQFVNPDKKYYKLSHTMLDNSDQILDEINKGYNTQEYIIDDAQKGEWIINIQYYGNANMLNPVFLKYTTYRNYGLANETKQVRVLKLYKYEQKLTLDKFNYSPY